MSMEFLPKSLLLNNREDWNQLKLNESLLSNVSLRFLFWILFTNFVFRGNFSSLTLVMLIRVTFYIGFDPEQFEFSLDLWFLFSCPAAFSRVFYVVFQIFKLKHFCNELLHERTVNFGSDTKTESASPKKVESSAGTFDWSEERTGRTGAHCTVGCKNNQNIF